MSRQIREFYEFEPYTVDVSKRLLLNGDQPVPLKPKVFDTLLALVENSGRIVEKEELMQMIWPDVVVEENNLTQNISAIRKSLGDRQNEHRFVVTVPGRGYRFVADVRKTSRDESPKSATAVTADKTDVNMDKTSIEAKPFAPTDPPAIRKRRAILIAAGVALVGVVAIFFLLPRLRGSSNPAPSGPATSGKIESIAVLPFKLLGAEAGDEYTGPGMADALITKLSNSKQLTVLSTSAVLRYSNPTQDSLAAGRELGVDSVLDGKIQRDGDHVRVTVQLVRVKDGASLWAQTFNENFTNIFAVQDSISEQVVKALTLQLSREERERMLKRYTQSAEAYQAYLKGRFFLDKRTTDSVQKARDYFQEAVNRDEKYALAYAGLADCYHRFAQFGISPPAEVIPKATEAARTALGLDDSLAEAHATLGLVSFRYLRDVTAAEQEFKRALELDPRYGLAHMWYGLELLATKRFPEAAAEMQRALELEPLSITINNALGDYYIQIKQYDQAIAQYRKTLEMDSSFTTAQVGLGRAYEQKGMFTEALEQFAAARNKSKRELPLGHEGHVYAVSGRKEEARKVLKSLLDQANQGDGNPYMIAIVYAGLGDKDEAFKWLEKAFADYSLLPGPLRFDPRLEILRSDARYKDLIRLSGLPE